jgi:tetratricopeptide (TPR) repeat protein
LLSVRLELAGELISKKNAKDALAVLDGAPEGQKKSLTLLAQRNWALWSYGNLQEMRKGIDQGLSQKRSTEFLVQDGLWKLQAGNAAAARTSLEEALEINPGDVRALAGLKDAYVMLRQAPMAVQKVKEYAAREPKSPAAQEFLGFVLWASGDRAAARAAFAASKAADPKFERADLAAVQLDAVDAKWDDAAGKLNALLVTNPANSTARLWLGNIQAVRGNPSVALENFRKVLEANPDNAQALNNYAYLLAEHAQKPDEALKYAEKALEKAPDNPEYADTLGWILYRKGLYPSAISYLERAASKGKPVANYHLAMAYAKAGDMKRGRLALDQALKQNSRLPEAKMASDVLASVK